MSKPNTVVMVCVRVDDLPIPGIPSSLEKCMECGVEVWCDRIARHDAVICFACVERLGLHISSQCHPDVLRHLLAKGYNQAQIERMAEFAGRSTGPRMEG